MKKPAQILDEAVTAGRIVQWTAPVQAHIYQVTFPNQKTYSVPGIYVAKGREMRQWLDMIEWRIALYQWRITKEVIMRKAMKRYGLRAKGWF